MKILIGAAVLAGASFLGYRELTHWKTFTAYENFAEAWVRGLPEEAMKYAQGDDVRETLEKKTLRGTQSGDVMDAFRGTRYDIENRTRTANGDVQFEIRQTIYFDPPGITTAIGGAMYTHFHHSATVRKTKDGWKVVSFDPKFLDMGEMPHGKLVGHADSSRSLTKAATSR